MAILKIFKPSVRCFEASEIIYKNNNEAVSKCHTHPGEIPIASEISRAFSCSNRPDIGIFFIVVLQTMRRLLRRSFVLIHLEVSV